MKEGSPVARLLFTPPTLKIDIFRLFVAISYFVGMCISLFSLTVRHKINPAILKDLFFLIFGAIISFSLSDCFFKLVFRGGSLSVFIEIGVFILLYILLLFLLGFFGNNKTGFMSKMYKKTIK